jgi:5-methylcytosine-specific restriction endonuclease McrA
MLGGNPASLNHFATQTDSILGSSHDAIHDIGSDSPDYAKSIKGTYARDNKIRKAVLRRAKGKCEFCGQLGFKQTNGKHYLECHHIIALAKDGSDRMTNVNGLCPNDHREAHFGKRHKQLEKEMIERLKAIERVGPQT